MNRKYCAIRGCTASTAEGSCVCEKHAALGRTTTKPPRLKSPVDGHSLAFTSAELRDANAMLSNRPKTRADCPSPGTPCPYLSCKHHLWVDLSASGMPTESPAFGDVKNTCALNYVEEHGSAPTTLSCVSKATHTTRQRVDQIVQEGLKKAKRRHGAVLREYMDYLKYDESCERDPMARAPAPVEA